ncbi:TnpA family transposase [Nonomuraea jabiensis]|uniref:TnpA family transposase n=1 Tax=Nonomuraea jabiensis TaxID=882448 RepID=A0A7W9GJW9_9ACTN|nr:DUF4158 domain-containing protein [Nonomuraea jabiensis]MBB5785194.1 TnpA family transposase [Nonomuraea jabiensis]
MFFLDDEDRALIDRRRGEHMKLGFGLQPVTVRRLGVFLEDPLDVPVAVLDFVSEQLGITDPSQVKRYTEQAKTKLDHQWEIRRMYGLEDFRRSRTSCGRGWRPGRGRRGMARRRSSSTRWPGCGSGVCCCRG